MSTTKHRYPQVRQDPPAIQVVRELSPQDRERLLEWMAETLPGPVRVALRHLPQIPPETAGHPARDKVQ